jgi:hypothetical protein
MYLFDHSNSCMCMRSGRISRGCLSVVEHGACSLWKENSGKEKKIANTWCLDFQSPVYEANVWILIIRYDNQLFVVM